MRVSAEEESIFSSFLPSDPGYETTEIIFVVRPWTHAHTHVTRLYPRKYFNFFPVPSFSFFLLLVLSFCQTCWEEGGEKGMCQLGPISGESLSLSLLSLSLSSAEYYMLTFLPGLKKKKER